MTDWTITVKKAITAFLATGGAAAIGSFIMELPQDHIIYGSITVATISAGWRFVTNAYKHKDD